MLRNPIVNMGNEQRDLSDQGAVGARYNGTRKRLIECLESDWGRLWAARTWASMDVWLGSPAAVLNLDWNGIMPCSHFETGGRLLLTARDVKAQTAHSYFAVRNGQSQGYFLFLTGEVGVRFYVSPGSDLYVYYSGERNKLLRDAFVMKEMKSPPISVL